MNNLISMEKWVIANCDPNSEEYKQATFRLSKPTLSMFVPCDDDGNVLEEPKNPKLGVSEMKYYDKYVEAKSKVIFDGWSVDSNEETFKVLLQQENRLTFFKRGSIYFNSAPIHTISDLTPYRIHIIWLYI